MLFCFIMDAKMIEIDVTFFFLFQIIVMQSASKRSLFRFATTFRFTQKLEISLREV